MALGVGIGVPGAGTAGSVNRVQQVRDPDGDGRRARLRAAGAALAAGRRRKPVLSVGRGPRIDGENGPRSAFVGSAEHEVLGGGGSCCEP